MEKTPSGLCKHVCILGDVNAGKSSLFNLLLGTNQAIVSSQAGTTTDPVQSRMELLDFGSINLIDTAGFNDVSALSNQRSKKTKEIIRRCDLILYVIDAQKANKPAKFEFPTDSIVVLSKCDLISDEEKETLKQTYPNAVQLNPSDRASMQQLLDTIKAKLLALAKPDENSMIHGLIPEQSHVLLVIPLDSEAPKGRLILPQVQLIRDLLDHSMYVHICRENQVKDFLNQGINFDLVVTDSQIFHYISSIVPSDISLTSFSILLAYQRGNMEQQIKGTLGFENLCEGSKIMVLESCKHNATHEDIGRVKIPALLQKKLNKKMQFDFFSGYSLPEDASNYQAAILCGSCMISQAEIKNRLEYLRQKNILVSNYGLMIAYCNDILKRASQIFNIDATIYGELPW